MSLQDLNPGDIPDCLSLKQYLTNILLPAFQPSNAGRSRVTQISRARQWPKYAELQREPGTRRLREVLRVDPWQFALLTEDYIDQFIAGAYILKDTFDEEEQACRLRLPSKDLVVYEDEDFEHLSHVDNEDDYTAVMQDYVLGTISEAVRIIVGASLDSAAAAALQFQKASHLCTAHHARWDILTLLGDDANPQPFTVVFVPPWEFGIADFADFTSTQLFETHAIDRLNTKPHTAADTLWAVVNDACQGRGKYFVVSNYVRWAFGEITPEGSTARITEPIEAPILNFDGSHAATSTIGFNVVEYLTFWTHHAVRIGLGGTRSLKK